MAMDEPEPVPTERVAPAISSPLLHERDLEPPPSGDLEALPTDFAVPAIPVAEHPGWFVGAGLVVVGLVASAVSGDPRMGIVLVSMAAWAGLIRSADRRLPFSFGEGFVGYRADLGWPQGVQEDDDVHWTWRPARPVGPPPAGPTAGR